MIDIKDLLYDIDLKLNKVGTNEHQSISVEDKIIALNDAQINIIKTKYSENNLYKLGFDGFQKRYNDLEVLVESDKKLPLIENPGSSLNKWDANLDDLEVEYMLGIPGTEYLLADKDSCIGNMLYVNLVKHGDIQQSISNTSTGPSFEYQETIGTISDHKYEIYTDGTFTPTEFHLSYIRYPKKVDAPGYIHFDGSESKIQNSELPSYLKEELVDIVVRSLAMSTENSAAIQASNARIQNGE